MHAFLPSPYSIKRENSAKISVKHVQFTCRHVNKYVGILPMRNMFKACIINVKIFINAGLDTETSLNVDCSFSHFSFPVD